VTGVLTSAFRDPAGATIAVVLINTNPGAKQIDLQLAAGTYGALGAWRTSATESLADAGAVASKGDLARVELPGLSVTTVYGSFAP
jgi:hypothetical protein